ncbi:acetyl-CoA carboxylase biotin carboxyl carrier protein subunit [Alkalihalobacillus pseudalcaliphilus]|uniref:acetyl-CoA carboxylase biotin carboxyl carrier protein subunit n=1 Tax=Alkalihalobacillus pseudalcaliphilus TaxID=79884 RepID=UPI00064DCFF0|nr:acetyl-CoA carboxylase biotin carboxyl carrier protein subunit [Alkalihalobacillus pseudalcaliphilus]KMK76134.1 acetyl-CoA carboxylase [Alkalihalobacillus pseudalcaliphilus]
MAVITASMAGNVWKLLVGKGEAVKAGDEVAILESMKMEIPITAEQDGIVKEVKTSEGDFINEGDVLFEME